MDTTVDMYPFIIAPQPQGSQASKAKQNGVALRYPSESGHSKNMRVMPDAKKMAGSWSISTSCTEYSVAGHREHHIEGLAHRVRTYLV